MLGVSLVWRVTARSLHDDMLGCQSPFVCMYVWEHL